MKRKKEKIQTSDFTIAVGRALKRAARTARKVARYHGTPFYVWQDGKVVAQKP